MAKRSATSRNTDETPGDLRYMAEVLSRLADSLRETARRMEKAYPRVHSVNVRHGVGAHKAITETLTPFAQDAAIKATVAGAPE